MLSFADLSPQFQVASFTALVTLILFMSTHMIALLVSWQRAYRQKKNLVIGLYIEIQYNRKIVELFLTANPTSEPVEARVTANADYIPHLTYARHTAFYEGQIANITLLKPVLTRQLIEFYNNLASLETDIAALHNHSFKVIEGRAGAVRDVWAQMTACIQSGKEALHLIEIAYPIRWVTHIKA